MNKNRKLKIVSFLKRFSVLAIIIFITTFLQLYWSMGHLSESMSSACLECWLIEDIFIMSVLTAVFLAVIFSVIPSRGKNIFKMIVEFLLLVLVWFYWDYIIFVERESSWSTYLFREEINVVIYFSFFPISILSVVVVFLMNIKSFNLKVSKYSQ